MNKQVYEITRVKNEAWIRMLRVGVRVVVLRAGTFVDLQKQIEAILGDEASALFYEAGIRAGKESTKVLFEEWEERGMDFLKRWGEFYQSAGVGWFKLEDINIDFEKENGYLRVNNLLSLRNMASRISQSATFFADSFQVYFRKFLEEN